MRLPEKRRGVRSLSDRDVVSGLPIELEITAETVYEAIKDNLNSICNADQDDLSRKLRRRLQRTSSMPVSI